MGGRLGVWKGVLLVWNGKSVELGACDGILLGMWMGMSLGWTMGDFWEFWELTPVAKCRSCFGWKIPARSQVGNLDGGLVRNFQFDPSWGIQPELCLEIVKRHPARTIKRSFGGQMGRWGDWWSGWSKTRCKRERCARWDLGIATCLEIPKPRLGAHADWYPCAKQGYVLLDISHKF